MFLGDLGVSVVNLGTNWRIKVMRFLFRPFRASESVEPTNPGRRYAAVGASLCPGLAYCCPVGAEPHLHDIWASPRLMGAGLGM